MYVLSAPARAGFLVVAVVSLLVGATTQNVSAHRPEEPDHGLNESDFWILWAGDDDSQHSSVSTTQSLMKALASGTDIPLDSPPQEVEMWNLGEHGDLPVTGTETASHPAQVALSDGTYLRDVGVSIMTLQPSTRVHLDTSEQPLYIAPDGTVLGAIDYRIAVPDSTSSNSSETQWAVLSHEVESVQLLLEEEVLAETTHTKTPQLSYSELTPAATDQRTLTLNATVSATLQRTVTTETEVCEQPVDNTTTGSSETTTNETTESCETVEETTVTQHEETVSVTDSTTVNVYSLTVSGFLGQYPNGDIGLVTYKSHPWYGISLPDGAVRGVWRFYAARDQAWDTQTVYSENTTTTTHSPVHPLEVRAYPIETGPTPWPQSTLSILDVYGQTYEAPALPPTVALDSIDGTYTGSFGIGMRIESAAFKLSEATAVGLVRGTNTTLESEKFATVPISQSNLTLQITNRTEETVTVQARLLGANTGAPIATADRDGSLVIAGQTVETNESGLAVVTVSTDHDAISARYEPSFWWMDIPGYTGDTAVVHTGGTVLRYVDALFRGFIPIGALLLGGYLISRFTTWGFWPPWRGL